MRSLRVETPRPCTTFLLGASRIGPVGRERKRRPQEEATQPLWTGPAPALRMVTLDPRSRAISDHFNTPYGPQPETPQASVNKPVPGRSAVPCLRASSRPWRTPEPPRAARAARAARAWATEPLGSNPRGPRGKGNGVDAVNRDDVLGGAADAEELAVREKAPKPRDDCEQRGFVSEVRAAEVTEQAEFRRSLLILTHRRATPR